MPKIDDVFERTIRLDERVSSIDEKIDRLIETVSMAPDVTDQTPAPGDSRRADSERRPNNLYEFTHYLVEKFGIPTVIIIVGIVVYFGSQEFYSRINQRDASVTEAVSKTAVRTLEVGKSVIDNAEKLIQINEKIGATSAKLLELQKQAADEAEKAANQKRIAGLEAEKAAAAQRKAKQAKENAENLRTSLTIEKAKVEQKNEELSEARDNLEKKKQKLKEANEKLKTEQANLAKERGEIELAKKDVAAREQLLNNMGAELSEARTRIGSLVEENSRLKGKRKEEELRFRKSLNELRAELATTRTRLISSQSRIAALERQRNDLINSLERARKSIAELDVPAETLPEVPELKEAAPVPVPVQPDKPSHIELVANVLRRYANNPNHVTRDEWRRLEDGIVKPEKLDLLLKTDLGFELVLKATLAESDDSSQKARTAYFLVRQITSEQITGVPVLIIGDGGKYWDVDAPATSFTFVRLPDLDDFARTQVATVADLSYDRKEPEVETILYFQSEKNVQTFSGLVSTIYASERYTTPPKIDAHYGGPEKTVRILGMAEAFAKFPALMKRLVNEDSRVAVVKEMENRAKGFKANELIPARPFGTETALRGALVGVIDAAVYGDTPAAMSILTKPLTERDLGRLAAIALRGTLRIDKSPKIEVAQTKPTPGTSAAPPKVPAASATVFASIDQPKLRPKTELVEFRFRRDSNSPQWKLIGFGVVAKTRS